jgi:dihydroorotate dehydrogenase
MFSHSTLKIHRNDNSMPHLVQRLIMIFLNSFKRYQTVFPVTVMKLPFSNPIGLAAGFDQNANHIAYSQHIGFGSIEIGTLNIDATKALDDNVKATIQNLKKAAQNKYKTIHPQQWGINLGSLRNTLDEQTVNDYTRGMNIFWQYADYLVINLSRPKSDTRALKPDMYALDKFLTNVKFEHQALSIERRKYIPIVTKIAIDYRQNESTCELLQLLQQRKFDGIILAFENWPNTQKIAEYLCALKAEYEDFPLIVVGGIRSSQDSKKLMAAGAALIQIYTALVEQGPRKTKQIITQLAANE